MFSILIFYSDAGAESQAGSLAGPQLFPAKRLEQRPGPLDHFAKPTEITGHSEFQPARPVFWDRAMDDEHRIATRHRVLKGGRILFGGGSIDCTVRNLSETGAALDVTSPLGIPSEFVLVTDDTLRPCRIVWRKEKRIGVTFEKAD